MSAVSGLKIENLPFDVGSCKQKRRNATSLLRHGDERAPYTINVCFADSSKMLASPEHATSSAQIAALNRAPSAGRELHFRRPFCPHRKRHLLQEEGAIGTTTDR